MSTVQVASFLKFGYFLDYESPYKQYIDLSKIDKSAFSDINEPDLVALGSEYLKRAIISQFDLNQINVVPLSGGLDSRAILAGLLECTEASKLYTYTFGTPGSLDYEIGNHIAKKVGTRHEKFPLTKIQYNFTELLDIAKRVDFQTVLFHTPPVAMIDLLYRGASIWSGAIIDVYFGRHNHRRKGTTLEEAKHNSINENIYCKSVKIDAVSEDRFYSFIDYDMSADNFLEKEHIIDLLNRQIKFIAPHVLLKGADYKVLFTDKDLVQFALNLDNKYLEDQYLYKKILLYSFPGLFKFATKSNYGLELNASPVRTSLQKTRIGLTRKLSSAFPLANPGINYIDFNKAIRHRADLQKLIYFNLKDFESRKLANWLDLEKIWKSHINNSGNYADILILIASLEIIMKAGKRISQ